MSGPRRRRGRNVYLSAVECEVVLLATEYIAADDTDDGLPAHHVEAARSLRQKLLGSRRAAVQAGE